MQLQLVWTLTLWMAKDKISKDGCKQVQVNSTSWNKYYYVQFHALCIHLLISCIQLHKEFEGSVDNIVNTGGWPINFVDHHHNCVAKLKSFLQHKSGLGHRSLYRVHLQQVVQCPKMSHSKVCGTIVDKSNSTCNFGSEIVSSDQQLCKKNIVISRFRIIKVSQVLSKVVRGQSKLDSHSF